VTKWPEDRLDGERLIVYRVVIQADVAGKMGVESVLMDIADIFELRDAWDVFDVEVQPRETIDVEPNGRVDT